MPLKRPKLRLIVGGGRDFDNWELLCHWLGKITESIDKSRLVIVHGACPSGADRMADDWAFMKGGVGVTVERHKADWDRHGKAAGPIRNREMVQDGANRAICFWDGTSKGTSNLIEELAKVGIKTKVVRYEHTG